MTCIDGQVMDKEQEDIDWLIDFCRQAPREQAAEHLRFRLYGGGKMQEQKSLGFRVETLEPKPRKPNGSSH